MDISGSILMEAAFDNLVMSSDITDKYFVIFEDGQIKYIPKQ